MTFGRVFHIIAYPLTAILIILSVVSCHDDPKKVSGRGGGRGATPVEALVIHPQPLENKIVTTGTLMANEEVELRPEIDGRVTGVFFDEGKPVKKGELLLKINDRELQADLKSKQLEEKLAADDESRKRALVDINGISREEYDKALNNLNMIKAEREVIESKIAETEIFAPFDGVIGLRYVSEGGYVTTNTLVATMQDVDPIKVEFSVPERYAGKLTTGSKVSVQVGDAQDQYIGNIYAVEAKIDPTTRTLKARATIPNPGSKLIPGSFAKVEITLEKIPDALVIPTEAVVPELNGEKVYICENGKVRSQTVTTGIRTDKNIEVTQGLQPNDTLIITGLLQLSDGSTVQITNLSAD
jgi:membrane fusion protein (multidrug efflux system)